MTTAVIDLRDFGVTGNGTNETAGIQAALTAAAAGDTVVFPKPLSFYGIRRALTVPSSVRVVTTASGCAVEQLTWGQPVFDLFNVDGVTIEGLVLRSTQTRSYTSTPSFRGSDPYVYNAGIWSNAEGCAFRDLTVSGFTCGIYMNAWDGVGHTTRRFGNTVDRVTVSDVDFGILAVGQDGARVVGMRGSYAQTSGTGNPPHLIYWSDGIGSAIGSSSIGITVADCYATGGAEGHAFQFKGVLSGDLSGLHAQGCGGVLSILDSQDLQVRGVGSLADAGTGNNGSIYVQQGGSEARIHISGVNIVLTVSERAIRMGGTDSSLSDVQISTTHASVSSSADVLVAGTRCRIQDLTVVNTDDDGGWVTVQVSSGSGNIIRNITGVNARTGVQVDASATDTRVDVDPAAFTAPTGFGGLRIVDDAGTDTNIHLPSRRQAYSLTGGTVTPHVGLGDYLDLTITGSSALTVANPLSYVRSPGMRFTLAIHNNTVGAMGAITWGGEYSFTGTDPVAPAAGERLLVTFAFDGTGWQETARAA